MLARWRQSGLLVPTLMTLVMLPILLGLGTWQLQRKTWKDGLQSQIDARRIAEPIELRDLLKRFPKTADQEYRHVSLEGTFNHAGEKHYYWAGPPFRGWHVYTPMLIADGGQQILVNRGFVPDVLKDPARRLTAQPDGHVRVTGLVRLSETPARFTPPNEPGANIWYWRDLNAMYGGEANPPRALQELVLNPPAILPWFTIDADASPANPGGWPRGGTTIVKLSNRHLEYAVTWYGFAVTLIVVFLVFAAPRWRQSRPDMATATDTP